MSSGTKVQIASLDQMETIVNNRYGLEWDGWDVVRYRRNNAGFLHTDGAFRNGKWYVTERVSPDRSGWSIPKKWLS